MDVDRYKKERYIIPFMMKSKRRIIKHEIAIGGVSQDFCCCCRVVDMDVDRGVVEISNVKVAETDPKKTFTFDAVYDWK